MTITVPRLSLAARAELNRAVTVRDEHLVRCSLGPFREVGKDRFFKCMVFSAILAISSSWLLVQLTCGTVDGL